MPFYIEDVGPSDAFYEGRKKFIGQEINPRLCMRKNAKKEGYFHVYRISEPYSAKGVISMEFAAVKIRWEDYPAEEVREGKL